MIRETQVDEHMIVSNGLKIWGFERYNFERYNFGRTSPNLLAKPMRNAEPQGSRGGSIISSSKPKKVLLSVDYTSKNNLKSLHYIMERNRNCEEFACHCMPLAQQETKECTMRDQITGKYSCKPGNLEIVGSHHQRMLARHLKLLLCQPPQEEIPKKESHSPNPESPD